MSSSRAMRDVLALGRLVAGGRATILITGESGVGKDLVARYIHSHSPRASRPFIAVNCAAFSESLLESELFGHAKGSFTDAYADKPGRLALAHHGTVFLDEIGEMSPRMQALLLRFLENGEIQPVGRPSISRVDVRVVAATNRDLTELVASGRYREDLLYRIKVIQIHVPALRERPEDIGPLVQHITSRSGRSLAFTKQALAVLERYRWPGNVRELQNVLERLIWTVPDNVVDQRDLGLSLSQSCSVPDQKVANADSPSVDELYEALLARRCSFLHDVRKLFLYRDLTRDDLRYLVRRGLTTTNGSYRALLELFGIEASDYKRLLNFLAAHGCSIDFRAFRNSPNVESTNG